MLVACAILKVSMLKVYSDTICLMVNNMYVTIIVGFYGGLAGLLPKKHLDLLPGQEAGDVYTAGQLLRCQVRYQQTWVHAGH